MANTFKVTTGSSIATTVGHATATIYTVPSSTTSIILSLLLSNKTTVAIKTSVQLVSTTSNSGNNNNRSSGANETAHIIKDVQIDEETSLEIMSGQKYVMQTGDAIKVFGAAADIDVVLSYMEIT